MRFDGRLRPPPPSSASMKHVPYRIPCCTFQYQNTDRHYSTSFVPLKPEEGRVVRCGLLALPADGGVELPSEVLATHFGGVQGPGWLILRHIILQSSWTSGPAENSYQSPCQRHALTTYDIGSSCAVVVLPDQGEIRCFLSSCSGCCSDLIQVFDNEFRQIFDRPQGHNVRPYSCTYQDGATQRVVTQARLLGPSHTLQIYSNAANKLCAAEYTLHAV